ncbi:MAG: hypothetical protein RR280_04355 [Bacteroidaceae bacterium]
MSNTSLEIKIRAAVEGLADLQKIRTSFIDLIDELENLDNPSLKAAKSVSEIAQAASAAITPLSSLESQAKLAQDAIAGITSAQSLDEIREQAAGALQSLLDLREQGVANFGELDDEVNIVTDEMTQLQDEINALTVVLGRLSRVNSLEDLEETARSSARELDTLGGNLGDAADSVQDLARQNDNLANATDDVSDGLQSIAQNADDVSDSANTSTDAVDDLASAASDVSDTLSDVNDAATDTSGAIDDLAGSEDAAGNSTSFFGGLIDRLRISMTEGAEGAGGLLDNLREYTDVGPTVGGVVGGLADTFSKFKEQIALVITGIVAFAAVSNLKESADLAARIETLGVTMDVVGKNTGYTTEQLKGYETEVKSLGITSEAARETITQMSSAGLELGVVTEGATSQVAQLARASQDLAVRMGGSSSETLQQMITNVQQLDTEGLRYMGIILDTTQAQEKYATQLGTTVGALTQAQKQQAVLNEVLAQARAQSGLYEESLDTVGKQIGSLSRYKDELAESIGNKLLPAYGALVQNTTAYLKDLKAVVENTDKAGVASANWADAMDGLSDLIFASLKSVVEILADANQGFSVLGATIGDLLGDVANLFDTMDAGEESVLSIGKVLGGFATTIAGILAALEDAAVIVVASFVGVGSAMLEVVGTIIQGWGEILNVLHIGSGEIQKVGLSWREMGNEGLNASEGVINNILQGEGALGEFNKRILEANDLMTKAKKVGAYTAIEDEVVRLLEAQRKGTIQSHELKTASDEVASALKKMGEEGKLTEKEIGILGSKLAAVGNKDLDTFNQSLELVGYSAQELRDRITSSFGEVVGGLKELAKNANTTSDIFFGAFGKSIDGAETINDLRGMQEALLSYQERLKDTGNLTEEEMANIRQQSQLVLEKFNEVFSGGLDSAKTSKEFAKLHEDTERLGKIMVDAGVMTEEGLTLKLKQVEEQAEKTGKSLEFKETILALEAIGQSFDELTTGVSDSVLEIVDALDEILVKGQLTSDQLRQVFDGAVGQAKTLNDLDEIRDRIQAAFDQGQISIEDFESAMIDAGAKFVSVFRDELSTVTTRQELEALRDKVVQLGEDGKISLREVSLALTEIEKASRKGMQSSLDLAQNLTKVGDAQLRSLQSQNDAYKAMVDVSTAYNSLEEARNAYYADGTELSREILSLKELEYEQAVETYKLAQLIAEQDQQNVSILIAQQKLLRAEKEATMSTDYVAAQQRILQIQNEIDAEQLKSETLLQNIQKQQQVLSNLDAQKHKQSQVVEETRKTAAETDKVKDKTKEAKDSTDEMREGMKRTGNAIAAMVNANLERSVSLLKEAGYTHDEAIKRGMALQATFNKGLYDTLSGSMTAAAQWWGLMEDNLQSQIKYKQWLEASNERQAAQEEKQQQRTSDIVSNAQRMAELGYDANVSWQSFVDEGLSSTSSELKKIQAEAKQTIKAAQQSVTSFLSSVSSIKLEYLEATGREEEALAMRYAQRKQELALEYEMLKVTITAAQITAKQAGISTAVLDNAMSEAKAGYEQAKKYLDELEKMEQVALKKKQDDAAIEAKKQADEALAEKNKQTVNVAELTKALQDGIAKVVAADPNKDGLDSAGQPLAFTFKIGDKTIHATTRDTKEDLIESLEKLSLRSGG